MRILTLSDINWLPPHEGTTLTMLTDLVERVSPAVVLLAGDMVDNDKGGGHPHRRFFWKQLGQFFDYLEARHMTSLYVQGNWDEKPEFEELRQRPYRYVKDISDSTEVIDGIEIYGINNAETTNSKIMRQLKEKVPSKTDIILAHAQGVRRGYLFELPADLIITGHFDEKMCVINRKLFLAFNHFPQHYAVIEYETRNIVATYEISRSIYFVHGKTPLHNQVHVVNGVAQWNTAQPADWTVYAQRMESLLSLKSRAAELTMDEKCAAIQSLLDLGVPKSQIKEMVSGASAILK